MGCFTLLYFTLFQSGLTLGCSNHRCLVSSPRPQSAEQPSLSALHICTMWAPITHLVLYLFDLSTRCTEWEQIAPTVLPLCWPSRCGQGSCMAAQSPFPKKSPWVLLPLLTTTSSVPHAQLSLTSPEFIWVMANHGPSLLPAPGVTQLPKFSGTVPACNRYPSQGPLP